MATGKLVAEISQVLANRGNCSSAAGMGSGPEDYRYTVCAALGDWLGSCQQDDDSVFGHMLDRDAREPIGELPGDRVGCRYARLLRLQPSKRFGRGDAELAGVDRRILSESLLPAFDGRSGRRGCGRKEQKGKDPPHRQTLIALPC